MAALTGALLALSAAKTVGDFTSQRRAATMAEQQGNAQGGLLDLNAGIADRQASDATARGDLAAGRVQSRGRLLAGEQTTSFAAQGLDTSSGSAADVIGQDRAISELDAMHIRNNAALEAWGHQTDAAGYRAQGQWARTAGANEAAGLRNKATGTLLSGVADLASIYQTSPKKISRAPIADIPVGTPLNDPVKRLTPGQGYG